MNNGLSVARELIDRLAKAVREGREDRVFLLLPTHRLQALARESVLTEAGVSGVRRLEILSFYQFIRRVLAAAGVRREPVDDALRRFILRHLLQREAEAGRLSHFARLAGSPGLSASFSRLIGELKLAGASPDELAEASGAGVAGQDELVRVYAAYQRFLADRGLADKEELQLLARDALRSNPRLLAGMTLLLDGFFDLTPVQAQILQEAASQADAVEFWLPAGDDRIELSALLERVERLLAPVPVRRRAPSWQDGGRPEPLRHLAGQLFRLEPERAPAGEAVRLVRARDLEGELRWAAREIRRLVREEGVDPGQVAVLLPDAGGYAEPAALALAAEGIPVDQAVEEPLDRNPLVRTVLLCLEAASGLRTGFDLLKLVRTGYLPGDEDHLAALRRVFRERGYLFSRAEWERRLAAEEVRWARRAAAEEAESAGATGEAGVTGEAGQTGGGEARQVLAGLRRVTQLLPALLDPLAALPLRAPLATHLEALEGLLAGLGLERAALSPSVPEALRVRDWSALGAFRAVAASLARAGNLLPEAEELTLADFLATLRAALTEARYTLSPAAPGGVALLTVTQSRGLEFSHVFFIELVDGVVPRPAGEDWLLPEEARRRLAAAGVLLDTARDRLGREKFLFHLGVTRAARRLYLLYPESDATGNVQLPSAYLAEVERLFAGGPPVTAAAVDEAPEGLAADQTTGLSRGKVGEAGRLRHPAVLEALAERRGPGFRWSAGLFGDYNRCPFRYFLQHELLAPPVEEAGEGLTPLERGQLLHEALRRYYREGGEAALARDEAVREAALRPIVNELFDRSPARGLAPHPAFWEAAREKALQQLLGVLARDAACFAATGFRPQFLEWGFGLAGGREVDPRSSPAPLLLGQGEEALTVVGKVDRIDVDDQGNFVVYDYKSGKSVPSWSDECQGLSLQLRVYLRAVGELLLPEGRPVGAAYFSLPKADAREGLWHVEGAAGLNRFHRKKSAGLLPEEEWRRLLAETDAVAHEVARRVRNGEFPLTLRTDECPRCRFRAACRVDEAADLEDETT